MNFKNYFKELKRRNVIKAGLAYLVGSWIIIQVFSIILPALRVPDYFLRFVLIVLVIGFPLWLLFSWKYEITEEGIKKTKNVDPKDSISHQTDSQLNKVIIGALVIAIVLLGINLFYNVSEVNPAVSDTQKSPSTSDKQLLAQNKAPDKSIAVLAFENMSSDEDQEYFADGISEEILNYLAKNRDLEVISRTSSFYFKDKEATTKEIGQKLHVKYLLEGSVRKAGNTVRITAQLINISTGIHIWSETYDRKLDDIFKIQDEIAAAVSKKLEVSLLGKKSKEVDTKAYTLYLKAKHLWEQSTSESIEKALDLLKEANAIDPNYAPIWELESQIYNYLGFSIANELKEEAYNLGMSAAQKSIEIDPEYAKGYMELARWAMVKFEFGEAKLNAEKAFELEPENAEILRRKGLMTFGSLTEFIRNDKKALELDPLLYINHLVLGVDNYWRGNKEEALKQINIYEEYQPGTLATSSFKTMILLSLGRTEQAMQEIEKEPDPFWKPYGKIKALYQAGQKKEALKMLDNLMKNYPKEAADFADIYAFMGNREKTFEWLHKALEIKDPTLTEAVYYPTFKKFHNDPRWQQLLEDMGVPEDNGIPGYKR